MGIMEFFGSLATSNIVTAIRPNFLEQLDAEHFFFDSNSIVHNVSQGVIKDIEQLFHEILRCCYENQYPNNDIIREITKKYKITDLITSIRHKDLNVVIDNFNQYFEDGELLDKLIIFEVIKTIDNMISTFTIDGKVKTIMFAFDGVPSKGKVLESRARRTMMGFVAEYKKLLVQKYRKYLESLPDYSYDYEMTKPTWSRINITPGTKFMHLLMRYMHDDKTQQRWKKIRKDVNIIISDVYEVGEGEKKILNYIRFSDDINRNKDKFIIYSPDSDVILYCMLMPVKYVKMLRYDVESQGYDLVDISELKQNIATYVNRQSDIEYDKERLSDDIVFLSTFFGNDFVPRIETINVKRSFQNIIDAYVTVLRNFEEENYLVIHKNKVKKINWEFLFLVVKALVKEEEQFIEKNQLYNRYIKFGMFINAFPYYDIDEENIVAIYREFTTKYGNLKQAITQKKPLEPFINDDNFIYSLKNTILLTDTNGITITTLAMTNKEFINAIIKYFATKSDFPRISLNLNEKSASINDNYHRRKIEGKNDFQIEVYKMENMLNEYHKKFNAQPLNLSKNGIEDYYEEYFKTTTKLDDGQLYEKTEKVVKRYLKGLLWVFQYYFNSRHYLDSWSYKYERAPLLYHLMILLKEMNQKSLDDMIKELDETKIDNLDDFLNPLELLTYMIPNTYQARMILPSSVGNWVKNNEFAKKFYLNLEELAKSAFDHNVCHDIDCKSMPYLSKCLLLDIHRPTTNEDEKFMEEFRKVEEKESKNLKKYTKIKYPEF